MRFDYKPKMTRMGARLSRRLLYTALTVLAVICLMSLFAIHKSFHRNRTSQAVTKESIETAATPIAISSEETTASTASVNTEIKNSPETSLPNPEDTWQDIKILKGDTLSKIFKRHGLPTQDLSKIMALNSSSKQLLTLKPNQTLKIQLNNDKKINALKLNVAPGKTLHIARKDSDFSIEQKELPVEKQLAFGKGEIHNSLFGAAKRVGLDHKIVSQMVDIFGWNIDFTLDLQPKDTFRVLYEKKYIDGVLVETGHILAAEIINDGKKHQAVRYTDKNGHTAYFSPDGYGMHQTFLKAPLNFTRISSHFGGRKHPILHKLREHKGVDYSAPKGTPVQTTGDGKVIFVGNRGGYGKVIEIQHGPRYSTLYAHLSKFAKLKVNQEVKQGMVIGYVGATGLATGPHLHYEFRIDGIHRDPLTVALPRKNPINDTQKKHFLAHAKKMIELLDMHENKVNLVSNTYYKILSPFDE